MNDDNPDVRFLGRCPICNRRYNDEEATLLREDNDTTMIFVDCVRCHSSVIFAVSSNVGGVVGMVTDMTLDDARRLTTVSPVSKDDVLAVHKHFVDVS